MNFQTKCMKHFAECINRGDPYHTMTKETTLGCTITITKTVTPTRSTNVSLVPLKKGQYRVVG